MPLRWSPFLRSMTLVLCLMACHSFAKEPPLQINEVFKDGITTAVGHYKGMEFGYEVELGMYQACGKAYTRIHGKENNIEGCMFEFKLRQGHLEIEETSKAAGYCGVCTPVKVYRVKDTGVIYLRTTVLPTLKMCKEHQGICW